MGQNQVHVNVTEANHARLQEVADASSISVAAALNVILSLALANTRPEMPVQPVPESTPVVEAQSAWLSPAQLAEFLQIPLQTIYSWRTRKQGPRGHKIGAHVRYSRADVNAWLDANVIMGYK